MNGTRPFRRPACDLASLACAWFGLAVAVAAAVVAASTAVLLDQARAANAPRRTPGRTQPYVQ